MNLHILEIVIFTKSVKIETQENETKMKQNYKLNYIGDTLCWKIYK